MTGLLAPVVRLSGPLGPAGPVAVRAGTAQADDHRDTDHRDTESEEAPVQVELRHSPSYAVARLHLAPGEQFQGEAGVMVMQSFGVTIQSQMQGGFMTALKRSALGGESFFVTTFIGHAQSPTWVDVAARLPGDATVIDCRPDRGIVLTKGAWLASETGVKLDTKWGGSAMLFGGEGGFVVRCSGQGQIIAGSFGALDLLELPPGQGFTIDTGHLVAYDDGMQVQVRKIAKGWIQTGKSGEGLVMDINGPGRVWTQSRNAGALVDWLTTVLPFTRA